jgi:hypothetical protein
LSNSDDREQLAFDADRFADDGRIGGEAAAP